VSGESCQASNQDSPPNIPTARKRLQINAARMKANVLLHRCEVTSGTQAATVRRFVWVQRLTFGAMSAFQFAQIGVIRSPYKEKFAVPRQPGLVNTAAENFI
jgi:hypothetical protein